jgi:hypothetical protein
MAERATTPRALWMVVVAPPIIGAIQMQANFVLVRQACSAHRNVGLYAVTIVAAVLIVATAVVAVAIWKRAGVVWPGDGDDVATQVRFISVLGMLSSAMTFLMILGQGIATIAFDPCQR